MGKEVIGRRAAMAGGSALLAGALMPVGLHAQTVTLVEETRFTRLGSQGTEFVHRFVRERPVRSVVVLVAREGVTDPLLRRLAIRFAAAGHASLHPTPTKPVSERKAAARARERVRDLSLSAGTLHGDLPLVLVGVDAAIAPALDFAAEINATVAVPWIRGVLGIAATDAPTVAAGRWAAARAPTMQVGPTLAAGASHRVVAADLRDADDAALDSIWPLLDLFARRCAGDVGAEKMLEQRLAAREEPT